MIRNIWRTHDMSDAELRTHILRLGQAATLAGFLLGCVFGFEIALLLQSAPQ